jgi:hypothetical protein
MDHRAPNRDRLARFIAAVLVDAETAEYWSAACAWLPGTGRCRAEKTIDCGQGCPFRPMREAEAGRIAGRRRNRRAVPRRCR